MFEFFYICSAPLPFHSPNTVAFVFVQKGMQNSLLSSTTEPKQNENEPYKGKALQPADRERKRERPHSCSAVRSREGERVGCLALKWSTNRAFVLLSLLFMCMCFDLWMCVRVTLRAVGTQLISAITRLFCFVVIFLWFFLLYIFFQLSLWTCNQIFFIWTIELSCYFHFLTVIHTLIGKIQYSTYLCL